MTLMRCLLLQVMLLVLFAGLSGAQAEEAVSVSFVQPGAAPVPGKQVSEMHLFADQPAALMWRMAALPRTAILVKGQVLQASSSIAIPLKELDFEVRLETGAGSVQAEARHVLTLPAVEKPAMYLVRWQAVSGEKTLAAGTVLLPRSLRGILTPLQSVSLLAQADLQPLAAVFEQDQVRVTRLEGEVLPRAWQGILIAKLKPADFGPIQGMALEAGQQLIVFGDLPGLPETVLSKQAGRGHLLIVPARRLSEFATSPAVQRLVAEFCQSPSL